MTRIVLDERRSKLPSTAVMADATAEPEHLVAFQGVLTGVVVGALLWVGLLSFLFRLI